jgi:hypothetical protein
LVWLACPETQAIILPQHSRAIGKGFVGRQFFTTISAALMNFCHRDQALSTHRFSADGLNALEQAVWHAHILVVGFPLELHITQSWRFEHEDAFL